MNSRIAMFRHCAGFLALILTAVISPAFAAECKLGIVANLPVRMEGMRASVPVKINGKDSSFWLDSGAFFSIMSKAKADELGLKLETLPPGFYLVGIGGRTSAMLTTIKSFGIVGQELKNMQFLVGGSDAGNGLIGRNILAMADTEYDLAHGSVKLIMPHDCGHATLSYWAPGAPSFVVPLLNDSNPRDRVSRIAVSVNDAKIEAEFDSGAPISLLSRRAAERAGIDLSGPNVTTLSNLSGFGKRIQAGWIVPVEKVSIGDEQVLNTHLTVIDGPIAGSNDAPDMLLGADFMLAHHIYIARSQRRVYFTYSGGKAFLSSSTAIAAKTQPVVLPPGVQRLDALDDFGAGPKTAEEFARRGNARGAQRRFKDAVADLSEAIRLAPNTAAYYGDRAKAYGQSNELERARLDIDKALALVPDNGEFLRVRAYMRLSQHDKIGALADTEAALKVTHPSSLDSAQLAFLLERLGQPRRAISLFDGVIATHRADSQLGQLLNGRCWVRALANLDLDEALKDCNSAIKRDGVRAAYLDSRGLVYFRKADFARAMTDYDAALKLNPNVAWSLFVRGIIKISQGQVDAGNVDQAAALAVDSNIGEETKHYGVGK